MKTRLFAPSLLVLILAACGGRPSAAARPTVQPAARYATTAAVVDDVVYVVGGVGRSDQKDVTVAVVEAYDPEARTWTRCAPMATARAFAAAAAVKGRIYVFGGLDASGKALASGEVYDPRTDRWEALPPMDVPRSRHAAAAHQGRAILVAGGLDDQDRNLATVRIYHPDDRQWLEWPELTAGRHGLALAEPDDLSDRAFAVGGFDGSGVLGCTESFGVGLVKVTGPDGKLLRPGSTSIDMQTGKATPIDKDHQGYGWWPAPALEHPRGFFGMARIGSRLFAVGGRCRNVPSTEVLDLDAVDAGWRAAAPLPKDLCRFSLVAWDGRLLAFGGETDSGMAVNTDVLEYDPSADRWSVR